MFLMLIMSITQGMGTVACQELFNFGGAKKDVASFIQYGLLLI